MIFVINLLWKQTNRDNSYCGRHFAGGIPFSQVTSNDCNQGKLTTGHIMSFLGRITCMECKDMTSCYSCSMVCVSVCVCWHNSELTDRQPHCDRHSAASLKHVTSSKDAAKLNRFRSFIPFVLYFLSRSGLLVASVEYLPADLVCLWSSSTQCRTSHLSMTIVIMSISDKIKKFQTKK